MDKKNSIKNIANSSDGVGKTRRSGVSKKTTASKTAPKRIVSSGVTTKKKIITSPPKIEDPKKNPTATGKRSSRTEVTRKNISKKEKNISHRVEKKNEKQGFFRELLNGLSNLWYITIPFALIIVYFLTTSVYSLLFLNNVPDWGTRTDHLPAYNSAGFDKGISDIKSSGKAYFENFRQVGTSIALEIGVNDNVSIKDAKELAMKAYNDFVNSQTNKEVIKKYDFRITINNKNSQEGFPIFGSKTKDSDTVTWTTSEV